MTAIILQCQEKALEGVCILCASTLALPAGNQLFLAGTTDPVCLDCGHKHAPALAALVNLAQTAERVGRIGRHSVFPPLTALLDLASAAEKYTSAADQEEKPVSRGQGAAVKGQETSPEP
jgi:hypothetical protein